MQPELQSALADIMNVLKDGATFAAAAAKQELPLLVQEYLRFGMVEAILWLAVFSIVSIGMLVMARRVFAPLKQYATFNDVPIADEGAWMMGRYALPIGAGMIWLTAAAVNLRAIAMILWAPRVYLLEQLSGLVK